MAQQAPVEAILSHELLRSMCEPSFEQVIVVLQQMSMASHELLQAVCEPFFEQMITALQQTMQQHSLQQHLSTQCYSMQMMCQPTTDMYFQPAFYPTTQLLGVDEASTDADFSQSPSLFSYPSSEGEASKSEDSESTGNVDKNIMVCKHWKSKGWCRLESKCKFLHLEHKCGISASKALSGHRTHGPSSLEGASNADGAASEMSAARHRKRGDRKGSTRKHEDHLADA